MKIRVRVCTNVNRQWRRRVITTIAAQINNGVIIDSAVDLRRVLSGAPLETETATVTGRG